MAALKKTYALFGTIACAVAALVFAGIAVGTLGLFPEVGLGGEVLSVALCVLFVVVIALASARLFALVEARKEDRSWQLRFAVALFVVMAAVMAWVVARVAPRPMTDSFEDIDAAMYLLKHGTMNDDFGYVNHVAAYGNNQLFIVALAGFFRLVMALGVTNVVAPLIVVNVLAILVGEFLFWLAVRDYRGTVSANRFLVLCALNPLYYGLACWLYTMTLSLPVMAAIVYGALRIWRAPSVRSAAAWGALEGVLVILGYGLRATAVFPFVAIVLVGAFVLLGATSNVGADAEKGAGAGSDDDSGTDADAGTGADAHAGTGTVPPVAQAPWVRPVAVAVALAITAFAANALVGKVCSHYFGELESREFPVSYWLAMGSNGDGTLASREDYMQIAGDPERTPQERSQELMDIAKRNYAELGLVGSLEHWANKTLLTWSDGYSWMSVRMRVGRHRGRTFDFLGGGHSELFVAYSQAFRLVTLVGVVLACVFALRRREYAPLELIYVVTLLGAVLFYCLWEAKNVYSGPFVLVMLALAERGFDALPLGHAPLTLPAGKGWRIGVLAFAAVVCVGMSLAFFEVGEHTYVRLGTIHSNKFTKSIAFRTLSQEFYESEKFNCLLLGVRKSGSKEYSRYEATLLDDAGNVLASWEYGAEDLQKSTYTAYVSLPLETVEPPAKNTRYVVEVRKLDPHEGDLYLRTTPTCYLDYYRGQATVDAGADLVGDIMLDVRYVVTEPYLKGMAPVVTPVLVFALCAVLVGRDPKQAR